MPYIPQGMREFCMIFQHSARPSYGWKTCLYLSDFNPVLHLNTKYFLHGFNRHWIIQECNCWINWRQSIPFFFVCLQLLTRVNFFRKPCPSWYLIFWYVQLIMSVYFCSCHIHNIFMYWCTCQFPYYEFWRVVIFEHLHIKIWFYWKLFFSYITLGINFKNQR